MKGLTRKQKEMVDYIQEFQDKNGFSPTYRDIMSHFQLQSPGSVYNYAKALRKKGILADEKYSRASIVKPDKPPPVPRADVVDLPFIGYLTVGYPIETFPKTQTIAVPSTLVQDPESTYILQVKDCDLP